MIRIGVMGVANIATRSVIPAIKELSDKFRLVAIASRDLEKARLACRTFDAEPVEGYEKLLERTDVDAIYMPLPTGLHKEWLMRTLHAGKHCYAEKSLALTSADAREMAGVAKERGLVLMEGYMFQYHRQHQEIRHLLESGVIGEVRQFTGSFGFPPLEKGNFRYDMKLGGGVLMDAAGYPLRALHFMLGDDFRVQAASMAKDDSGSEIYGGAFLSNGRGVPAHLTFGFDNFYQCSYSIWGSKGKITAERAYTPKPDFSPRVVIESNEGVTNLEIKPDNHFRNAFSFFFDAVTDESKRTQLYREILLQSESLDLIRNLSNNRR